MPSNGAQEDRAAMLAALEVHGRAFLNAFPTSVLGRKRKTGEMEGRLEEDKERNSGTSGDEDDDWHGFGEETDEAEELPEGGEGRNMDGSSSKQTSKIARGPQVVRFAESFASSTLSDKASYKSFMSSKVSKLTKGAPTVDDGKEDEQSDDDEQQASNALNDAELHRLVHTKLLSASLNPELNLTPAQKRKAVAGRVLELAGEVKLGKGETAVRTAEKNKAIKRIRDGMRAKQGERDEKALEEAKQLGNYHPTIKRLFAASSAGPPSTAKRTRGLGLGVGKFSGGTLRLSKTEIESVQGSAGRGFDTQRGGRGRDRVRFRGAARRGDGRRS